MSPSRKLHVSGWLFVFIYLVVMTCAAGEAADSVAAAGRDLRAGDVVVPAQLGEIQNRYEGDQDQPLILIIGESHVALEVQESVAKLLGYLRAAYDVKLICSEGLEQLKELPTPARNVPLEVRRFNARAGVQGRRINGVEYVALAYPDARILGASNMPAYTRHGRVLERRIQEAEKRAENWLEDFQQFLIEDVATLPFSPTEGRRLEKALSHLKQHADLDAFTATLSKIVAGYPSADKKLRTLLERREELRKEPDLTNDPLMKERDHWLAVNSSQAMTEPGAAALIIGKLHIPGVEAELQSRNVSFVTILANGAEDPGFDDSDEVVYSNWKERRQEPFEKWLLLHKPPFALERQSKRNAILAFDAVIHADFMQRHGATMDQLREMAAQARLPGDFKIEETYRIRKGNGLKFTINGKTGFAYFSTDPKALEAGRSDTVLEEGKSGDRHYRIYDGGSGRQPPPIPPSSLPPPGKPGDDWFRFPDPFKAAVEEQKKVDPRALTIAILFHDDSVVRRIGEEEERILGPTPREVRAQIEEYNQADPGPDKVFAAQQLADMLLVDVDAVLPPDRDHLYLVLDSELPADLPLPLIAELAGGYPKALTRPREFYAVRPKKPERLREVLGRPRAVADIGKTVVWITDDLRGTTEYAATVEAIEAAGATVNETPPEGGTLLMLGSGEANWRMTLNDGSKILPDSSELRETLKRIDHLSAVNVALTEPRVNQLHTRRVDSERAFRDVQETVVAIREGTGKESLDRIQRERAQREQQDQRENLTIKQNLGKMSQQDWENMNQNNKPTWQMET